MSARLTGSYSSGDWEAASYYDNTQTVIDGGVVTSGTVQLAGNGGNILAGITGNGTTSGSVRKTGFEGTGFAIGTLRHGKGLCYTVAERTNRSVGGDHRQKGRYADELRCDDGEFEGVGGDRTEKKEKVYAGRSRCCGCCCWSGGEISAML